jgi:hypothetical protein
VGVASATALHAAPFALLFAQVEGTSVQWLSVLMGLCVMLKIAIVGVIRGECAHESPPCFEPAFHDAPGITGAVAAKRRQARSDGFVMKSIDQARQRGFIELPS